MAEKIYTIPINEAFDRYEGCPLCYLIDKLQDSTLNYCLGAAMMEPDVRIEMNSKGFCQSHGEKLSSMKNKLGLALILETRLDQVIEKFQIPPATGKRIFIAGRADGPDGTEELLRLTGSCYVCEKIKYTEGRYLSNTVYLWDSDIRFRDKLSRQPFFCLTHFTHLLKTAKKEMKSSSYTGFYEAMFKLESEYFLQLRGELARFSESFDHRNAGKPMGDEKYSIEKALSLLK
ncbi:MAG: hypothetical protein GX254_00830 [Clostridiales bacterium]|nr:hypothetical protein [Clostridiales bacterium]